MKTWDIDDKTNERTIQLVEKYSYFGSTLMEYWKSEIEVKTRIDVAKEATNKQLTIFCSSVDLEIRKKLVKEAACGILLHTRETMTLGR